MGGEGALHCHCGCDSIAGASKGHEEGISLGVHLVPVPLLERGTVKLTVLLHHLGIALTHLLKQARGALDVREEQAHGSSR
jgi:hypothetical protein